MMRFEYMHRVTTQSWSVSCAMSEAESSINKIIDTFGQQHIDSDTLGIIKTFVYRCCYDDALWCLMGSLDENIKGNEPLLLLFEESWTLLCHFQERRVLNFKEMQEKALNIFGRGAHNAIGVELVEIERVAESCHHGMRRVSDYRNKVHHIERQPANPSAIPSMIQQKKDSFKIKAE